MAVTQERQRALLAYEASLRALDQQQRDLVEMRSRTGILIATASLSASFLGTWALDRDASVVWTIIALTGLVLTLIAGTVVLAPRKGLAFSVAGSAIHAELSALEDLTQQHLALVAWLEDLWTRNTVAADAMNVWFQLAAGALIAQILAWAVAISGTL